MPGDAPRRGVVALGGGHGVAVALRAIRQYADPITAVVSVADDGGSSGRLRRDLGVPAPGDLRKSLVALAGNSGPWAELEGHALGNLVLVGLAESMGGLADALDEAGRVLGTVGRVVPATVDAVILKAEVDGEPIVGQVAVESQVAGSAVPSVGIVPPDAPASPAALEAIADAAQVVVAPGSLYTSVLAVLCVPEIRDAVARCTARVIHVANLRADGETAGLDGTDQLRVLLDHGARIDVLLHDPQRGLAVSETAVRDMGVVPVAADLAAADARAHDPEKLSAALAALL